MIPARRRVIHFASGNFTSVTQVAIDLTAAAAATDSIEAILVLRRKGNTGKSRIEALRRRGLQVHVLPGWAHWETILEVALLCWRLKPDVLVAHGLPEHLIGRIGGWLARVKTLVHVEHNSREHYTPWRLAQARWLGRRSAALVGVSEGVRRRLVALGMPADRTRAISNGVLLERFARAEDRPFDERLPDIVMLARFGRQKDQLTLIQALGLLRGRGLAPKLHLVGAGHARYRREAETEVRLLGLGSQVWFHGHHADLPGLLMGHQLFVLATHWEGMPLALVEGMVAGCACLASNVPGLEGVFEDGVSGLLVPEGNAAALADALERLLRDPARAAALGAEARRHALAEYGLSRMMRRYEELLATV